MSTMEYCIDFVNCLDSDTSVKILMCLDDPADLVRVSCVSRSWRHCVIANGLCKQLCLRMFPQLSRVARVVELDEQVAKEQMEVGSSNFMEWLGLERDHRIYAYLARASTTSVAVNCISKTIGASSTDNFPEEGIDNTLDPRDIIAGNYFYWSSKGQRNPNVPETLTYELVSQICVVTEINIQPFQANFQMWAPIYSSKSVRLKMGHRKTCLDTSDDEKFVWTYTSPEFPMAQENRLQKFKLPEPVLCIGGILQIELLGRVQRQEMDDLFYICISYVKVIGFSLSPAFSVEILDPSGLFELKSGKQARCQHLLNSAKESGTNSYDNVQMALRDFPQIVNILREHVVGLVEHEWDEEEYEGDDFEEEYAL
ncbi:hypothetical protein RIF29_30158 [Crotalaria pallida]|uniref:F-box domain-containing protein n=1 Tax=Crotalaria pallida TaxID=3830 RepID=A0AAN9EG56_CROPI